MVNAKIKNNYVGIIVGYIKYYRKHPRKFLFGFLYVLSPIIPPKLYLKIACRILVGYRPNIDNPKTFIEKLQWIKLNDHKPIYVNMVDKYLAKEWVSKNIGKEYVVPLLGVYDKFDDIDFDKLPNQFVLKCNHDSGSVVICEDKGKIDKKAAKRRLDRAVKRKFYHFGKEWVYKYVEPRIICEELLNDGNDDSIKDYKWFCFNGEPQIMYISNDHGKHPHTDFYDMDFNHLDLRMSDPNSENPSKDKPIMFEKMKELARKISKGTYHLRVDFYCVGDRIYFGEATFYTNAGFVPFPDKKWDYRLGEMVKLPIN